MTMSRSITISITISTNTLISLQIF